jgi:hypothetical protein
MDEDDTAFPPEWTVVERIVAERAGPAGRQFLVKWQGLPYGRCSWESEEDIRVRTRALLSVPSSFALWWCLMS